MATTKEDLVTYCGLYCEDCILYKGEIADLARDLRKKLRESKFDKTAKGMEQFLKEFKDYETCYKVLGAMVRLRCKHPCRTENGGPPFCKVRKCCIKKGTKGCWECEIFETCEKHNFIKKVHGEATMKNLRKLKKKGVKGFIKGKRDWYA